jgi:hypothetical protein
MDYHTLIATRLGYSKVHKSYCRVYTQEVVPWEYHVLHPEANHLTDPEITVITQQNCHRSLLLSRTIKHCRHRNQLIKRDWSPRTARA